MPAEPFFLDTETNCRVLYTEDMQHGRTIENRLTLVNPFLPKVSS